MTDLIKDAYFAGLIDGEGHITLQPRYGRVNARPRAVVEVNMTCKKTIEALHHQYGGTLFAKKPPNVKWKPQWRWRVTDVSARSVLERIRPFLITKKDQAEFVILGTARGVSKS